MNKPFSKMTPKEVEQMSDEDWRNLSPFEKKHCYDCAFLKSALSHYCSNDEAKKMRGTSLPAICQYPFWKPNWNYIDKKYKTQENGHVPPVQKIVNEVKEKAPSWRKRFLKIFKSSNNHEQD